VNLTNKRLLSLLELISRAWGTERNSRKMRRPIHRTAATVEKWDYCTVSDFPRVGRLHSRCWLATFEPGAPNPVKLTQTTMKLRSPADASRISGYAGDLQQHSQRLTRREGTWMCSFYRNMVAASYKLSNSFRRLDARVGWLSTKTAPSDPNQVLHDAILCGLQ